MNSIKLGIIGGMGPRATLKLFEHIILNTPAKKDQEHIRIFIDNNTKIPDRTEYLLGLGPNPVPDLISSAKILDGLKVSFILIPCNTSHVFIDEIQKTIQAKILNMIEETALYLKRNNVKRACLFATLGTMKARIYNKYFEKHGIDLILPNKNEQEFIHEVIYDQIKAENYSETEVRNNFEKLYKNLPGNPEVLIKGCTEISLIHFSINTVDPMEVLAISAINKINNRKDDN